MIYWVFFFALIGLSIVCTVRFVPVEYRRNYARYREDWLAAGLFNAIWIISAIQCAVAPSVPPPGWLRNVGALMTMAGYALVVAARCVNPFFVPAVTVPDYIVTAGPYAWMSHPGYLGLALAACGAFFLFGQLWAFFPTFAYLCLLARRIHIEERLLSTYFQR